jgi:hypothetical protein
VTRQLFSDKDLGDALRQLKQNVRQHVLDVPESQFLSSTPQEIREHLLSTLRADSLVLYEDQIQKSLVQATHEVTDGYRPGVTFKVPSLELVVKLPYSGPHELFLFQPSMYTTNPPVGSIGPPNQNGIGYVTLRASINAQGGNPDDLQREIDSQIRRIRDQVGNQKANIDQHNAELPRLIDENVAWRRKTYDAYFAAAEKLNIPLQVKPDAPPLKPIEVHKRLVVPLPPATKDASLPAEPGITDSSYELILQAIRNQGRQFERTPETYAKHDEEELRDMLWGNLSTHFGRDVNGEAFSRAGKTDIRIEENGRAAFIAECKVWNGSKQLQDALVQLLGYLRWRDCKTSLIVFNKDRDNFTSLLEKAPTALKASKFYRGDSTHKHDAGEARMVFASPDDDGRRVTVHLFLFDLCI